MKILFFVSTTLLLLFACNPTIVTGPTANNTILNYKMEEVFRVWPQMEETDWSFMEANSTYLDDGLRYHYALLKDMASIKILEQVTGEPVFLSGPHTGDELNFYADRSFGYYNPKFWERVKTVVDYSLENDAAFKQLGKYVYNQKLKKTATLYYDSYQYLQENKSLADKAKADYEQALSTGSSPGEVLQETFRAYANTKEELGQDWYIANTAPGFWIRREIDGTADEIFEILTMVRRAYN
jgi:hypothetical protein